MKTIKNRKLKYNPDFVPREAKIGDELYRNGVFEFNISEMLKYIEKNYEEFRLVEIQVSDYTSFSKIEESQLENININKPGIIAEISPENYNLIDGNHRIKKAQSLNIDKFMVYKIPVETHINFLTNHNSYKKYIEYWNDKLNQIKKIQ